MGNCRFCRKPAGFLRHEHKECRQRHDEAAAKIPQFFVKSLQSPIPGDRFRELIDQDASQNFIAPAERDQLIRQGLGAMIHAAVANKSLSDALDHRIGELQEAFGVTTRELGGDGEALYKARVLQALTTARAENIGIAVEGPLAPHLEAAERAFWCFAGTKYLTLRTRTHYVGGSMGISIRVARGVYYRAGSFRGDPVRTDYLSTEDIGALTIAERNVCFVGSLKALKIPLCKVASTQLYSDGIEILQNGASAKPAFFTLNDPIFAANLLARLQDA